MASHVIHRGNNRGACFTRPADREFYLGLLQEVAPEEACSIHAYVLMTNHVHILATPRDRDGLSRMMKRVAQRYAARFNRLRKRTGSFWEGRFRSSLVDTARYLLTCSRYIELNPVRAGLASHPRHHPWSSYRANAEGEPSLFLSPHPVYLQLGKSARERRRRYRGLVASGVTEEELIKIREAINASLPVGSDEFLEELEARLGAPVTPGIPGRRPGSSNVHPSPV